MRPGVYQVPVCVLIVQIADLDFMLQLIVMLLMIGGVQSAPQEPTAQRMTQAPVRLVKTKLGALMVLTAVQHV